MPPLAKGIAGNLIPSREAIIPWGELMHRVAAAFIGKHFGALVLTVIFAGRYIPVLRCVERRAKNIHACSRISIPAVDDLLLNPLPQLVSICSGDTESRVVRDPRIQVQILREKDRKGKVLGISFGDEYAAAGIAGALQEQVVSLMVSAARSPHEPKQDFVLVIEAVQFFPMLAAIVVRSRFFRVADETGILDLSHRHELRFL